MVEKRGDGKMTKKAYVLNPHDDDGIISIGGTLCQLIDNGWEVGYIQMADGRHGAGEDERYGGDLSSEKVKEMRAREAEEERKFLGVKDYLNFDIEDGTLERYKENKDIIGKVAERIKDGDVVFIPNRAEGHPDHRATYEIGHKALELAKKPLEIDYIVWLFPFYPHNPGKFDKILNVGIDNQIERKLEGIRKHDSQVKWGRYDEMAKHINQFFSLIYSTYKEREKNYSEIIGIPKINEKFNLIINSLENVEDVTEIFHGKKSERIRG